MYGKRLNEKRNLNKVNFVLFQFSEFHVLQDFRNPEASVSTRMHAPPETSFRALWLAAHEYKRGRNGCWEGYDRTSRFPDALCAEREGGKISLYLCSLYPHKKLYNYYARRAHNGPAAWWVLVSYALILYNLNRDAAAPDGYYIYMLRIETFHRAINACPSSCAISNIYIISLSARTARITCIHTHMHARTCIYFRNATDRYMHSCSLIFRSHLSLRI